MCPQVAGIGEYLRLTKTASVLSQEQDRNVKTVVTKAWPDQWRCSSPEEQIGTRRESAS